MRAPDDILEIFLQPGEFYFQRGAEQLHPFEIVEELVAGKLSGEGWLERARALGIEDLRLGPAASAGVPPTD